MTWLYGPLQTDPFSFPTASSPPPTCASDSGSVVEKKSILKKRTRSQSILQRSLSTHTLLKHAGAILQAQQAHNSSSSPSTLPENPERLSSDLLVPREQFERVFLGDSLSTTPSSSDAEELPGSKRRITFKDEVEQFVAVDEVDERPSYGYYGRIDDDYPFDYHYNYDYDDDTSNDGDNNEDGDESSDDGVVMMKQFSSRSSSRSTPRSSFSSDSKIIAPLPPTTLKDFNDSAAKDSPEAQPPNSGIQPTTPFIWWPSMPKPSRSPSLETIRPEKQDNHDNFLLNEEDDDDDDIGHYGMDPSWQSSFKRPEQTSTPQTASPTSANGVSSPSEDRASPVLSSQIFRPQLSSSSNSHAGFYRSEEEEEEEEEAMNYGLFGKVIDTVNTARDIAHVIWNVGWRP